MKKLLPVILCFVAAQVGAQTPLKKDNRLQNNFLQSAPVVQEQREGVSEVFEELEKLIAVGEVRSLVGYIGSQVYLDVSGGSHGYFSSNQALSLLESYFAQRKPQSFALKSINQRAPSPFATGTLDFVYKGNRETAQVYIALSQRDSLWLMTQFTIY
ncbi:MAG: DUF4783 domain-containing protein [Ignavibacteriae bacterium]|nr:DUF4783 domain-containing protein [Ignavibacteriota bacterium]